MKMGTITDGHVIQMHELSPHTRPLHPLLTHCRSLHAAGVCDMLTVVPRCHCVMLGYDKKLLSFPVTNVYVGSVSSATHDSVICEIVLCDWRRVRRKDRCCS